MKDAACTGGAAAGGGGAGGAPNFTCRLNIVLMLLLL
jgi:hypothetical protein